MFLINERSMASPALIDLNPVELNYCPFMNILDKCNGNCNVAVDLSLKIYVLSKTKDLNVKTLNMVTKLYDAKTLVKCF